MNDSSAARSGAVQAATPVNQTTKHRDNTGILLYDAAVLP
jgi:hypothetical protein